MKTENVSFYDFDWTITKEHTFAITSLRVFHGASSSEMYQAGTTYAIHKMKTNIKDVFKHDKDNLSAIVTHHDNHAFIAGCVSSLLKKKLTETSNEINNGIGIACYSVADTELPFFICYSGDTAVRKQHEPSGKNLQISLLRSRVNEVNEGSSVINFFDDDRANYEKAQTLPLINCNWIDGAQDAFVIKERHSCELPVWMREVQAAATTVKSAEREQKVSEISSARFFTPQQRWRNFIKVIESTPARTTL